MVLCVHRRWVHSAKKGRGTTLTSGQCSAADLCGSAMNPSASAISPQTACCPWQGSSTGGQSTGRWKSMPCRIPASTACGRWWRASSWSPARAQQATGTTVTCTQSSDVPSSFQQLPPPPLLFLATSVQAATLNTLKSLGLWIITWKPEPLKIQKLHSVEQKCVNYKKLQTD